MAVAQQLQLGSCLWVAQSERVSWNSSSVCTLHDPVARIKSLKKATSISSPAAARRSVTVSSSVRVSASAATPSSSSSSEATVNPPKSETLKISFKHVLLPIIDKNPYLSDSTRQTVATTTTLARQYGADVTVVVIDHHQGSKEEAARDESKEAKEKHELQLDTIRWHLSEGGCEEYTLVEKRGEGQKPAAVIGEMADDLGLDLVIMSMEAIHHKHVDGNLLGEFVPCPILMLPL
ncbi:unnamed protein product [Calypogeia fissa]